MKLSFSLVLLVSGVPTIVTAGNLRSLEHEDFPPLVTPVTKCTRDAPCGECQGDCRVDADCEGELICFQKRGRAKSEEEAMVPGKCV